MLTEEQIAELKAKHGDELLVIDGPTGPIVVRKPIRLVYDKYQDAMVAKTSFSSAAREMAQYCVVFPAYAEFMAALEKEPSLLTGEVLGAMTELAGNKVQHDVKKL